MMPQRRNVKVSDTRNDAMITEAGKQSNYSFDAR